MIRLIEELRPKQIISVAQKSSMVFIPVSPRYEWHSYHLPLGTDGIIAEETSKILAEKFNGLYFRCLPIALDEIRNDKFKEANGLEKNNYVFGMNFPNLPIESEYITKKEMNGLLNSRIKAMRNSDFKYVFLVNHHGGAGQFDCLKKIAKVWDKKDFRVIPLMIPAFNKFHPVKKENLEFLYLKIGGHAGLLETHQLMAFRPDLVDLDELPEGELLAVESGILHNQPRIESEFNPRHAKREFAEKWRDSVIENLSARITEIITGNQQNN